MWRNLNTETKHQLGEYFLHMYRRRGNPMYNLYKIIKVFDKYMSLKRSNHMYIGITDRTKMFKKQKHSSTWGQGFSMLSQDAGLDDIEIKGAKRYIRSWRLNKASVLETWSAHRIEHPSWIREMESSQKLILGQFD